MHAISADLAVQRSVLRELNIDRAYLSGLLVREPPTELAVYCKVCPVRNSTCFPKTAFQLGWEHHLIECPNQVALWELRQRQLTPVGRAKLRERIAVEHALAHIGRWQGRRARYRGLRKNLFDLRRSTVVHSLHIIARLLETSGAEAA